MAEHIDYQKEAEFRTWWFNHTGGSAAEGLTVRDYFAAKVINTMIDKYDESPSRLAAEAYKWADAMLKERMK